MSHVYEDNAGVLLWRGSEAAACPTLFKNRTDLHRRELCFSRKTTQPVHQRGSVAWRIARVATFTAGAEGTGEYRTSEEVGDQVRLRPAWPTSQDAARLGRASLLPTGDRPAFLFPERR